MKTKQNRKSKTFILFFSALLMIFSSCTPRTGQTSVSETPAPAEAPTPASSPADQNAESMSIKWKYFDYYDYNGEGEAPILPSDGKIAKKLNEAFGVAMEQQIVKNELNYGFYQKQHMEENRLPDIFTPYQDIDGGEFYDIAIEAGGVRTIPWSMIERYAPRYAAFVGNNEAIKNHRSKNNSETYVLMGLEKTPEMLRTLSVYRLDWLEGMGISPPGEIIEIADNIYFTDKAFTLDEFVSFTENCASIENSEGLYIGLAAYTLLALIDETDTNTLMGMFGANWTNIMENGEAVLSAGSVSFQSYLIFIESLLSIGAMSGEMLYAGDYPVDCVGWWPSDIYSIPTIKLYLEYINGSSSNWGDRTASAMKLLLAPPEIGTTGRQGVDSMDLNALKITEYYMIRADVSDEKLAKILEIFDAVSFDPETYMLVNYGLEGEDYEWEGEPFDSPIIKKETDTQTGVFSVKTIDGNAGKHVNDLESEELYRFVTSPEARAMNMPPFKSDPYNEYSAELASLESKYPNNPYKLAREYYMEIATGKKKVADSWDEYIESLELNGLAEFTGLINKYPKTN